MLSKVKDYELTFAKAIEIRGFVWKFVVTLVLKKLRNENINVKRGELNAKIWGM